jgi:hypothetical protein
MTGTDSPSRLYKRTSEFIATDVEGELVLLHTLSWNYFEFDKGGAFIWTLLEVPRSLSSLIEILMGKFDVDEARCRAETRAFLDAMIGQGLVAVVEG